MESVSKTSEVNNGDPVFEIKKWNAVAVWAWGTKLF